MCKRWLPDWENVEKKSFLNTNFATDVTTPSEEDLIMRALATLLDNFLKNPLMFRLHILGVTFYLASRLWL
jgi:hypothetical protein